MSSEKSPRLYYVRFTPAVQRISMWLALVLAVIIAQQSLSVSNAQGGLPYLDKIVHFIAYGALGVFALPAFPRLSPIIVVLALGLFGGIIEIGQGVMGLGRTPDFFDAVSNLGGAFMALIFWQIITKLRP